MQSLIPCTPASRHCPVPSTGRRQAFHCCLGNTRQHTLSHTVTDAALDVCMHEHDQLFTFHKPPVKRLFQSSTQCLLSAEHRHVHSMEMQAANVLHNEGIERDKGEDRMKKEPGSTLEVRDNMLM